MYLKHCEVESRAEYFKCDIQEVIKSHLTIKKWAYILHDKDDTAPHYHIYLNFGSSGVDTKDVAAWFGLSENFVSKIKGRYTDMLAYLTHSNDSQQHKYQYATSEVVSNFAFEIEVQKAKILGDFEHYSYAQQLAYVNSLPISEKTSAYTKLEKLWRIRCQVLSLNPDREIDVMFIEGKGGSGKTYYAKKLLTSMGYDYCVSSSSNDPFQDYLGQQAIILDDLRDDVFIFEDLLKILDNNTSSSAKSRFSNKVFNGKIIVITSSVPLVHWYRLLRSQYNSKEVLYQLYRRISCYVHVTEKLITVYHQLDADGKPTGLYSEFKNELAEIKGAYQRQRRDFATDFQKICEPMPLPFTGDQDKISDFP